MDRTVDISGWPKRAFQYVLASFIALGGLVFGGVVLGNLLDIVGVSLGFVWTLPGVVALGALWVVLTVAFVRQVRAGDGDWWGPIPREQYLGRFAGHGGLARHSWERSIERLHDQRDDDD